MLDEYRNTKCEEICCITGRTTEGWVPLLAIGLIVFRARCKLIVEVIVFCTNFAHYLQILDVFAMFAP